MTDAISTEPDCWVELYERRGYASNDPVMAAALHRKEPFYWTDLLKTEDGHRQFWADVCRAGMVEAVTVPIRHGGYVAMLTVVPPPLHRLDRHLDLLYFLSHYFLLRARRPLAERNLALTRRRKSALFPREAEVLSLIATGKVTVEIASVLGISRKSVEFHIEGAKRKLAAANRTHAVAKAITLGLIDLA